MKEKLQKINIALVSLVIILVAGTMLLFHISKLNKKLKRSEAKVIQQNKELVENGEELRKARGTHRRIKEYERGCTGGSPEGGTVGK